MAKYERQYYNKGDQISRNRQRILDPKTKLEKLRTIPDEGFLSILGHRNFGEAYKAVHPPLSELGEPEDPMRDLVPPTEGAKAGDKMDTLVMTDSVYDAPIAVYLRAWMLHNRARGLDTGCYSGRNTIEMRARDLEDIGRMLLETEVCDVRRNHLRQMTCTGHSCRLDQDGLMFDAMRRTKMEGTDVVYVKSGFGISLDKPVNIGKGVSDEELKKRSSIYRYDNIPNLVLEDVVDPKPDEEVKETTQWGRRIMRQRLYGNLNPELIKEDAYENLEQLELKPRY